MHGMSVDLDDLLLDVAAAIELSDNDRKVAGSRYNKLQEYIQRPQSPILPYLNDGLGRIYPQGSMSIGTTVITGEHDERFDVDAIVELNLPNTIPPKQAVDLLYQTLENFPGALEVERCTRCVQLRFARMHMDVTPMQPHNEPRIERAGLIFHSPDSGTAYKVESNPYGFSEWFREVTQKGHTESFGTLVQNRRSSFGMDRLYTDETKELIQDDLPEIVPPRIDSEQVVALKLLKRFLSIHYQKYSKEIKRPPSIYITKLSADIQNSPYGIFDHLQSVARSIALEMEQYVGQGTLPDVRNPSYEPDVITDRWPRNQRDMKILSQAMQELDSDLGKAKTSSHEDVKKIFSILFGEEITKRGFEGLDRKQRVARVLSGIGKNIKIYLNPKHRKEPEWPLKEQGSVSIQGATMERNGFRQRELTDNDLPIPTGACLKFHANTNIPQPFDIYWQVVNTGRVAESFNDLRGDFNWTGGSLTRNETTKYPGQHTIQCFVVKDGAIAARSDQFLIKVE